MRTTQQASRALARSVWGIWGQSGSWPYFDDSPQRFETLSHNIIVHRLWYAGVASDFPNLTALAYKEAMVLLVPACHNPIIMICQAIGCRLCSSSAEAISLPCGGGCAQEKALC